VTMIVAVTMTTLLPLLGRHHGVRDQVEERVPEETPRGKGQHDLEQPLVLRALVQRDQEEDEERGSGDEECGHHGIEPDGGHGCGINMLIIIVPVGMEIGSVFGSLLGCGLLLLTMTMSMSTMAVSMTTMAVSVTPLLVRMRVSMVVNMSMAMPCDGLDVLQVYPLLLQGRVLLGRVGGFAPLEGGRLLSPMGVTMTMIMSMAVTTEH